MSGSSVQKTTNMVTNKYVTTDMFLNYFTDVAPSAEDNFVRNQIVIEKENQVYQGSK